MFFLIFLHHFGRFHVKLCFSTSSNPGQSHLKKPMRISRIACLARGVGAKGAEFGDGRVCWQSAHTKESRGEPAWCIGCHGQSPRPRRGFWCIGGIGSPQAKTTGWVSTALGFSEPRMALEGLDQKHTPVRLFCTA